ncbi:FIST signal transduction protein [Psychroserpens sp.]|uniref:FIST signal transduction protein n=1 Tax=Psychroserpens sp. TaxID=2020870 RepID=UPI001B14FDC1|nr:FIST N-terminal domain-containing protein [Psychroserpens sp.]MBO6606199.1 FIST C-terminal domain-containing protein [Psychroserpens sp.]MBO6631105.1 FIST C-terminal domain-containing protein [Psychroserpens sp.]MBO6652429.1 FIST C-terminal domain-containing protein [Psychroserpens sp.]MBO6681799.1 FIST C-terminal domain-containing protein [Psychroserpens sp.]MBO6749574.1 FIST C-terminal domain-containing protein [Psychroserpens sp.]
MKVKQLSLTKNNWQDLIPTIHFSANLCLLFVSPDFPNTKEVLDQIKTSFPDTLIIGCSTAGEISGITVKDETIALTAIQLEKSTVKKVAYEINDMECSQNAGETIADSLYEDNLKHVIVLSDGLNVNGAELVSGLKSKLPNVSITGGLAADGSNFNETFIIDNDQILDKTIVGIGFYGEAFQVGFSSKGGWDSFGIERLVTKSKKNVLYELDGLPALELYKSFLGDEAENLPSSGLLFPLSMRSNETEKPVVRTILGINEEDQSLTFAGNIPEGSYVRLMKANIDRLIGGAEESAKALGQNSENASELAILISCVGRRLVLKQLVEEEIEVVRDVIGDKPKITGFYSYGEIAPFGEFSPCELHNQTMTITTLTEC